jgi:phytoene dehydrogenase-like protein
MDKSVLIIGAGITGLAAGCYARMNGYQTHIFEQHTLPGGLCTGFKRKGYWFDGCIQFLLGTGPGTGFNRIWQELGPARDWTIFDPPEFVRLVGSDGTTTVIYNDAGKLEEQLVKVAPEDAAQIRELCADLHKLSRWDSLPGKPRELVGMLDNLKMLPGVLPYMGVFSKYRKLSASDYAQSFKSPFLRRIFPLIIQAEGMPMLGMITNLAWVIGKNGGIPLGGSLQFAQAIERRYRDLGGELHYQAPVEKILTENQRAVGVRLEDGTEWHGDAVISAVDARFTLNGLLEGRYPSPELQRCFDRWPTSGSLVQVSLGVGRDLSREAPVVTYLLDQPVTIGGRECQDITVRHFCYDRQMAPAGKSSVTVILPADYGFWKTALERGRPGYEAEKEQVAGQVIRLLEGWYPGLAQQVEVVDVATPLTYERYTGNWLGSYKGWRMTVETMDMTMSGKGLPRTLPGLDGFYLAGQWVEPGGGVPTGALSARGVIQLLCARDKQKFRTTMQ